MSLDLLTAFFMWCTIINGGFLVFIALIYMIIPNLIFKTQQPWFPMSKETFSLVFYAFIGLFKIFYIIFILVPYIALLILA